MSSGTRCLDTHAWAAYLRQSHQALVARLQQQSTTSIALCSIVLGELNYGAERSDPSKRAFNYRLIAQLRAQFISLPFDDLAAEQYGKERARLAALGTPIGPNDLMIASIALAHRLTLVTHNTSEFSRVVGLVLEDWQTP